MKRISVIGTTGAGKSTLAKQVAGRLRIPCTELDAIQWQQADWEAIAPEEFQRQVAEAVRQECWVIEGSYSAVRPLIWERADTVLWLDFSLPVIFSRLLRRTVRRVLFREKLWGGNTETLTTALFSRDSLLIWCLKTYERKRRQFPELLARPENAHLTVLRFRTPQQAAMWISELTQIRQAERE